MVMGGACTLSEMLSDATKNVNIVTTDDTLILLHLIARQMSLELT